MIKPTPNSAILTIISAIVLFILRPIVVNNSFKSHSGSYLDQIQTANEAASLAVFINILGTVILLIGIGLLISYFTKKRKFHENTVSGESELENDVNISEKELFEDMYYTQVEKLLQKNPKAKEFIRKYIQPNFDLISTQFDEKINQTLSDGEEHSRLMAIYPVCYDICVVPYSIEDSKKYFDDKYGGFGQLLANLMHKHPAFVQSGAKYLVAFIYGRYGTKCWMNIAIVAPKHTEYSSASVIPIDLLNKEELNIFLN